MKNNNNNTNKDIAIIGVGFRLPGDSNDPESLWNNLMDGFDAISVVPKERWSKSFKEMGMIKNKYGGFLKDSEWKSFDPLFFGIGNKEAPYIDPQQRILLSIVWESLEDAQIKPDQLRGSNTGVFIGVSNNDYSKLEFQDNYNISPYTMTGTNSSLNSNRISYCFDFRGPSMTVDTACSSSLVSVNLGCQSIQSGDCDIAIAGGVNALFDPSTSVAFSKLGVLSENGRCNSFSDQASGYVRSEGAGVVILKSLKSALADGNRIYGVIKGVSSNEDGSSNDKNSLTTPSCNAQAANIEKAMKKASLSPSDIYYIEAHGTGTPVGDPIEVEALSKVFKSLQQTETEQKTEQQSLLIGSFKSNIGHLESAAGIASLIKVCLMLKNRILVPSINCTNLNPAIPFDKYNISVVRQVQQFPSNKIVNIGINSFGFGGSNCHLIIQEFNNNINEKQIIKSSNNTNNIDYLIPISTGTKKSMDKYLNLIKLNSNYHNEIAFKDFVKFQIFSKASNLSNKMTVIANDWNSFIKSANETYMISDGSAGGGRGGILKEPTLVFVFCGQGPQWQGMGKTLYQTEPIFKNTVDHVDNLLAVHFGYSILSKLHELSDTDDSINHPIIAQPSLFLLQIGLIELYKYWGIYPNISVGHSFGEVTSYFLSGLIDLETACKIVYVRSFFQNQTIGTGKMLVVSMSAKQWISDYFGDWSELEVACYNSPDSIVVTGNELKLKELAIKLQEDHIFNTFLRSPCSFHSSAQEIIKDAMLEALNDLESTCHTEIPLFSTVTGNQVANGKPLTAQQVYDNVREPVYFQKAIESITTYIKQTHGENQKVIYIEIAPHPTLASLIKKSIPSSSTSSSHSIILCPLNRKENENTSIKKSISQLYFNGVNVDFSYQLNEDGETLTQFKDSTNSLPRYQWDQEEYWNESLESKNNRLQGPPSTLLGHRVIYSWPIYQTILDLQCKQFKYLLDHLVKGKSVFPGAGYLDIIIQFVIGLQDDTATINNTIVNVDKIQFLNPLFLDENKLTTIQSSFEPVHSKKSNYTVNFFIKDDLQDANVKSIQDETWTNTCKATISFEQQQSNKSNVTSSMTVDLNEIKSKCNITKLDKIELYEKISKNLGLQYKDYFQIIQSIETGKNCSFATLQLPKDTEFTSVLNSCLLDNCFHGLLTLINEKGSFVVESVSNISIHMESVSNVNSVQSTYYLSSTILKSTSFSSEGTCKLYNKQGELVLSIGKFTIVSTNPKSSSIDQMMSLKSPLDETFSIEWQSKDSPIQVPQQLHNATCSEPLNTIASFVQSTILKDSDFEKYCSSLIHSALISHQGCSSNGFKSLVNSTIADHSIEELMDCLNISKDYSRFFTRIISIINQYPLILSNDELSSLKEKIQIKYPKSDTDIQVIETVSNILPKLLLDSDKQAPMSLFQDNLLTRFYSDSISTRFYLEKVSSLVIESIKPIVKEKRVFRILEIGAGTGSLSNVILKKLNHHLEKSVTFERNLIIEYTFTDISSNFILSDIQEEMCTTYPNIVFKFSILNLEKEIDSTQYLYGDYDIVLMAYVIHAVENITFAISQLYKLLSPRGWLLAIEPKSNIVFSDLVFGCFEQWWNYNDEIRTTHCSLSSDQWNQVLIGSGKFSNLSFIGQLEPNSHSFILHAQKESISQMKLSTAPSSVTGNSSSSILMILNSQQLLYTSNSYQKVMEYIQEATLLSKTIEIIDLKDVITSTQSVVEKVTKSTMVLCLFGLETNESNYQEQSFQFVKLLNMISSNNNNPATGQSKVLLITKQTTSRNFCSRSLVGISRTAMNEYTNLSVTTIDLDSSEYSLQQLLKPVLCCPFSDTEFIYKKGLLFVSRLFNHTSVQLLSSSNAFETDSSNLYCTALSDLSYQYKIRTFQLQDDHVEIKVVSVGINFKDSLFYKGLLPNEIFRMGDIYNPPFGLECSGIVTRVGKNVSAEGQFKIGDNVFGFARHSLGSHVITSKNLLIHKPDSISFQEAASIPVVYCTAYYSLFNIGQLSNCKEDSVLIHSATGGVGLAALNLLKMRNFKNIYTTVGSDEKKQYLLTNYSNFGLVNDNILSTRTKEYSSKLEGKIDVVLNTLSGDYVDSNFKSLKSFGRLVDLSATHIYANQQIGLSNFKYDHLYTAVDLERLIDEKPLLLISMLSTITGYIENGTLDKIPIHVYPSSQTKEAIELLSARSHIGKIIVDCRDIEENNPVDNVLVDFSKRIVKTNYQLSLSSTLLITGQSGLSIPLLNWLLSSYSSNVKHVVILSKSPIKWRLQSMIGKFTSNVQFTYVQVDISNYEQLSMAIKQLPNDLPPIKSVFHLAAIYNDVPMNQVSMKTMESVHNPKVMGAINLHRVGVSFGWNLNNFILFSSITAITGYPDQSVYNSANSVLDALSSFRRFMGLPCFSINLGPMKDEGKVSTSKAIKQLFKSRGLPSLSLNKLFALLEVVINNPLNLQIPSQLICSPIDFDNYLSTFSNMKVKSLHLLKPQHQEKKSTTDKDGKSDSISLQDKIISKVSDLLSIPVSKLNYDHPLKSYGLDSLLTIQLKSWIDKEFEKNLFTHIQLSSITINSFLEKVIGNDNIVIKKDSPSPSTSNNNNDHVNSTTTTTINIKSISPDVKINNSPPKHDSLIKTPLLKKLNLDKTKNKIPELLSNSSISVNCNPNISPDLTTPPSDDSYKSLPPISNHSPNVIINSNAAIANTSQQIHHQPMSRLSFKSNNNSFVLGIGTSVPGEAISQDSLKDSISSDFSDKPEVNEKVKRIFEQSHIKTRYLVRDYTKPENSIKYRHTESITEVNQTFKKVVPELAEQACIKAIKDWGGNKDDITHIMSVSSTGIIIPDVNFKLIALLGLNPDVERVSLNLMGCLAGLSSLRTAASLAKASTRNRILVVCTEVCSLHFSNTDGGDQMVASSIFADGSAAYIVGCSPRIEENPLYEVLCSINRSVPNTEHAMVWDIEKEGWNLGLDSSIPIVIGSGIEAFVDTLLDKAKSQTNSKVDVKDCEFLIHTGGKSIIMNIENSLGIDQKQTKNTWDIYHSYGNMSSASVIFVMDHARKSKSLPTYSVSLAFGPGLAFEGCFLKNIN